MSHVLKRPAGLLKRPAGLDDNEAADAARASVKKKKLQSQQGAGTLGYLLRTADLRDGPQDIEELADWPELLWKCVRQRRDSQVLHERVKSMMAAGIVLHSECSGKLSLETALKMLFLDRNIEIAGSTDVNTGIFTWKACDTSSLCQRVALASPHKPIHVFKGMLEVMPQHHQDKIIGLRPPASAPLEQKKEAYAAMGAHLREHQVELCGRHSTAMVGSCLRHPHSHCQLYFQDPDPAESPPSARPLTMSISGPPCTPFTSFGNRLLWAHEDMEAYHLWVASVANASLDIVGIENSADFVEDLFHKPLQQDYEAKHVIFDCCDLGLPTRRKRFWGAGLHKSSLVWVGESGRDVTQHFREFFFSAVRLEGDIYFGLRADEEKALRDHLARNRGMYGVGSHGDAVSIAELLPVAMRESYEKQLKLYADGTAKAGFGGAYILDVTQSADRPRCGPLLPAQARNTLLLSISKEKFLTPTEVEFSMGWPSIAEISACRRYSHVQGYCPEVLGISSGQRTSLSGNSMVLPALAAFWLYILCYTVRRDQVEVMSPMPTIMETESDDDSDDIIHEAEEAPLAAPPLI